MASGRALERLRERFKEAMRKLGNDIERSSRVREPSGMGWTRTNPTEIRTSYGRRYERPDTYEGFDY